MKNTLPLLALPLLTVACAPPDQIDEINQAAYVPPGGETMPPYNPCAFHLTVAPDKTINLGPDISEVISTLSIAPEPVVYWPQPQCPGWEFDVVVPYNAHPKASDCGSNGCYPWAEINAGAMQFSGSTQVEGGFYVPSNGSSEAFCEGFKNYMAIYKKPAGSSTFSLVKSFLYRGTWTSGGGCIVKAGTNGYYPNDLLAPSPPASGTDTYRIVTYVVVDGQYRSMRVKVDYEEM